jgi:LmbE family N-acetylglucosaminyl deacetylase
VPPLKPVWHFDHRATHRAAPDLVELELRPGWRRLASVARRTVTG